MISINVQKDTFKAGNLFFPKKIRYADVEKVEIRQHASLADEIAIIMYAPEPIVVADSELSFWKLAYKFKFSSCFGKDWYKKAECGNIFELTGSQLALS